MNYSEFALKARRPNSTDNNKVHFFAHYFSTYFAFACFKLGLSPNNVTLLFLFSGLFSGISLYLDNGFLAYLFWRLHIILDMSDGELARATNNFSKKARGFDKTNHILINSTILIAPLASEKYSLILANILVAAFFVYYTFSQNYNPSYRNISTITVQKYLFRNILGLEGFVLIQCINCALNIPYLPIVTAIVYSLSFSVLFSMKLRLLKYD